MAKGSIKQGYFYQCNVIIVRHGHYILRPMAQLAPTPIELGLSVHCCVQEAGGYGGHVSERQGLSNHCCVQEAGGYGGHVPGRQEVRRARRRRRAIHRQQEQNKILNV